MRAKPLAVPPHHGVGLDDDQGGAPLQPAFGEGDPKESVSGPKLGPCDGTRHHGQLLTKRKILKRDRSVSAAEESERSEEYEERRQHVVILSCLAPRNQRGGTGDPVLANHSVTPVSAASPYLARCRPIERQACHRPWLRPDDNTDGDRAEAPQ
jgi:hypothetical protein